MYRVMVVNNIKTPMNDWEPLPNCELGLCKTAFGQRFSTAQASPKQQL